MSLISTRANVIALKEEITESVPAKPASATDYVADQGGSEVSYSIEVLENAERKNSLAKAKPLLGKETPTASLSHYFRHSGVEGQAPNYAVLLKAIFGKETINLTERDLIAGSTNQVLKVDAGEGVEFPIGRPVLIKDSLRYVRFVDSVTTDDLSLNFKIDNVPALGINLGKPVYYTPENKDHPTFSYWNYLGNKKNGAIELMTGSRITSFDLTADAGQPVNASYSLEGVEAFFDPIEITATTNKIDVTTANGTFLATVTPAWYKDPIDLAEAIESSLKVADPLETFKVTYDNKLGKYTIEVTGATLELLFLTGANTAENIALKIGFTVADQTGAITYTSDSELDFSSEFTPTFDAEDFNVAKSNLVLFGDFEDNVCFEASTLGVSISTPRTETSSICSESGVSGSVINGRDVTVTLSAYLQGYDAKQYHRYHKNKNVKFQYTTGKKSGGNWIEGTTASIYLKNATISEFNITDSDNLAIIEMTLTAFAPDDGSGEIFLGFL